MQNMVLNSTKRENELLKDKIEVLEAEVFRLHRVLKENTINTDKIIERQRDTIATLKRELFAYKKVEQEKAEQEKAEQVEADQKFAEQLQAELCRQDDDWQLAEELNRQWNC